MHDPIELAVLDMAGTTLDVADAVPGAMRRALGEVGVDVSDAWIRDIRGRSKLEALRSLLEAGHASPGLAERVHTRFHEELVLLAAEGVAPIDGARGAIAWLRGRGIPVWLTTGFDRGLATELLSRLGSWPGLVSGVVTADDVERGRPDPAMIRRAMAGAGVVDPGLVVVAGDTRADLEAARAAGAGYAIGVLTGAHDRERLEGVAHSAILETLADLPDWLVGQGAI